MFVGIQFQSQEGEAPVLDQPNEESTIPQFGVMTRQVERVRLHTQHGRGAHDGYLSTSVGSALQPRQYLSRSETSTPRQAVTYTMAASFTELVTAVDSYTTVDVTADILFEETINISDVVNGVIMSSTGIVFDGQNKVQMFTVSESFVEFRNITFINGYTEMVSDARGYLWWVWVNALVDECHGAASSK